MLLMMLIEVLVIIYVLFFTAQVQALCKFHKTITKPITDRSDVGRCYLQCIKLHARRHFGVGKSVCS